MNHILFPITYDCNLSCKFCAVKNSRAVEIESSVQALYEKQGLIEWVYITGGEPFLIEDLPLICDRIKAMGFKVGITTNGTIFRPEIADHVDRLGISLDGDKEYHDTYRGEGVFDKALRLFKAVRGKCETVIMSTSFNENREALKRLEPIVEQMDPTYWQVQRDVTDPTVLIPITI